MDTTLTIGTSVSVIFFFFWQTVQCAPWPHAVTAVIGWISSCNPTKNWAVEDEWIPIALTQQNDQDPSVSPLFEHCTEFRGDVLKLSFDLFAWLSTVTKISHHFKGTEQ